MQRYDAILTSVKVCIHECLNERAKYINEKIEKSRQNRHSTLDVARCYLWLFTLYINIKIGKIIVKC